MSIVAVMAIAVYVTAPVAAQPAVLAASTATSHPSIVGVVKGDPAKARVTLVFRNSRGRILAVRHPRVARDGIWRTSIPHGAVSVAVTVRDDGRTAHAVERIAARHSLRLTAVFPPARTGLVPGLFPY